MKALFWIVIVVVLLGIVGHFAGSAPTAESAQPSATAEVAAPNKLPVEVRQKIADLRDEGIDTIGWVAGNAKGHTTWPQVQQYVDKDGLYYNFFISLKGAADGTDEADALGNIQRYESAVNTGGAARFSSSEELDRTERAVQITKQIGALLKAQSKKSS